jgi:hypothetical protein
MTNTHHIFRRGTAITAISLLLIACTVVIPAIGQTPPIISKRDLKQLSSSPADQKLIATYYRDKAQHLRAKAKEFSREAEYLATQPATIESKQGISCNCTSHYRYFSKLYAQEAKDAETLAAQHEQLARPSNAAQQ